MTGAQLAEAREYRRLGLWCTLLDRAIDLAFLGVMALVLARPLDAWLRTWPLADRWWSLRLAALFLVMFALHVTVSLPLSYYAGFVLEHRFKLSTLSAAGWAWRYAKMLALALLLGLVLALGLFWIIWTTGPWWWLVGTGAFFLVGVMLARIWPVLIEPLFYTIERLDRPDLHERLARLAQGTGLAIEGVYRIALSEETVKANAQLAGLGQTRRVLLGDTLLDQFSPEEIEVVFAHEIGHHVLHHVRKLILAGLAFSAAGFWACDGVLVAWVGRWEPVLDYAAMPVYAFPMAMFFLTALRTVLGPLGHAISRRYERQADRYALARTGLREAFRSAFCKLAQQNKDDPSPPRLEVLLLHSHPPIAERLALAGAPAPGDQAPP